MWRVIPEGPPTLGLQLPGGSACLASGQGCASPNLKRFLGKEVSKPLWNNLTDPSWHGSGKKSLERCVFIQSEERPLLPLKATPHLDTQTLSLSWAFFVLPVPLLFALLAATF